MEPQRKTVRSLGFLVALSTPVTAFISFALFAVLFGEEHLEGSNGASTALGTLTLIVPLLLGLGIAAWAHFGGPLPSIDQVLAAAASVGLFCIIVGATSIVRSTDDASIGGGLLVLFGLAITAATIVIAITFRRREIPPPPPIG